MINQSSEECDVYVTQVSLAVATGDINQSVRLLGDERIEFWIRREGLEQAIEFPDAVFSIAIFNRLFRPLAATMSSERAMLLEWWLNRESRVNEPERLIYLRPFLLEAAALYGLHDRTLNAVLDVFAACTQQASSISGWATLNNVARRFFCTLRDTAPDRLVDSRMLRGALWSGELDLMKQFVEVGIHLAAAPDQLLLLHYLARQVIKFGDKIAFFPSIDALYRQDPCHPLAIQHMAETLYAMERSLDEIIELYDRIDESLHSAVYRSTIEWIAQICYARGFKTKAAELFSRLPPREETLEHYVSWQQRVLQDWRPDELWKSDLTSA